ncbi:MAG: V4R domain-containing protein [Gemmatimonadota bacterium]
MASSSARPSELALPVASLAALRDALYDSVGAEAAEQALRQAGYAAGDALFRILGAAADDDPGGTPADRFWSDFSRLFSGRGWGQISFSPVHDGVGSLDAPDWVESRANPPADQPSCHFSTGVLANILGQVADAEVAVLEVECRSRGDQRCRFLFGGADAVYSVYEQVAAGAEPDNALAQLG